ncbi:MAG: phosphatase PAP2 family protein [Bacilli bacterium]|nr:phosphatase PAP2 family protein [Bacilli bacterium]
MKEFQLEIIRWIQQFNNGFLDSLFEDITMFGEELIAILIIAFMYFCYNKQLAKKLTYIMLTSMTFNGIIKNIVKAPRPIGEEGIRSLRVETATGYSFPSGHTQTAATLYTSLSLFIKKRWASILTTIIIILVAISRLYLGVHYPADVIVGAFLGIAFAFGGNYLYDHYKKENYLFGITAIIFIPFAIFFAIDNSALSADFFKLYGLFVGAFLALVFEKKYVNFTIPKAIWKKAIRLALGLLIIIGIKEGLKIVFPDVFYLHFIRYFLMAFVGFGLYPMLFKKLRF